MDRLDQINTGLSKLLAGLLPRGAYDKFVYNLLPRLLQAGGFRGRFFDHGYAGVSTLNLAPEDVPERNFFQLYHHVAQFLPLEGKTVLEVGCGRGGGCYYYHRYRQPARIIGLDYSTTHVDCCRRLQLPAAEFHQGIAEHLPFATAGVDVLMNVESSHAYRSVPAFLHEAARVLKDDGVMGFCDIRATEQVSVLEDQFRAAGMRIQLREDITPNVLASIAELDDSKEQLIRHAGWLGRFITRDFLITSDSNVCARLRRGELRYVHYHLKKTVA